MYFIRSRVRSCRWCLNFENSGHYNLLIFKFKYWLLDFTENNLNCPLIRFFFIVPFWSIDLFFKNTLVSVMTLVTVQLLSPPIPTPPIRHFYSKLVTDLMHILCMLLTNYMLTNLFLYCIASNSQLWNSIRPH